MGNEFACMEQKGMQKSYKQGRQYKTGFIDIYELGYKQKAIAIIHYLPQHGQTKQSLSLRLYPKEKTEIGQKEPSAIFLKTRKIELKMSGILNLIISIHLNILTPKYLL